jgi:hypothetical protein
MRVVKAAAVQLSPVLYSREGTVEKIVRTIHELGQQRVQFAMSWEGRDVDAGLTATKALAAVERAVTEARKNGLEPVFGIEAASQSFAFVAAMNKEAMKSWRAEKKNDRGS